MSECSRMRRRKRRTFLLCLLQEHAEVKLADAFGRIVEGVEVEPVAAARVGVERGIGGNIAEATDGVPMLCMVQDERHLRAAGIM